MSTLEVYRELLSCLHVAKNVQGNHRDVDQDQRNLDNFKALYPHIVQQAVTIAVRESKRLGYFRLKE